jgi:hypothetical protein
MDRFGAGKGTELELELALELALELVLELKMELGTGLVEREPA